MKRTSKAKDVQVNDVANDHAPELAVSPLADGSMERNTIAPERKAQDNIAALVEQARLSVLAQVKDEAEAAKELGRQRGLREGRQAGLLEAKAEFTAEFTRIKSIAENLHDVIASGIKEMEDLTVAIVFESVCKILGNSLISLEAVQAVVREATQRVRSSEKLTVRVHPADLEILRSGGVLDMSDPSRGENPVVWLADTEIALGGCVLETETGNLDARMETQLENLRTTLLNTRNALCKT